MFYGPLSYISILGYELPSQIAIKCAEMQNAATLIDEERLLRRLDNPYIIHCHGDQITPSMETTGNKVYNLLLEYCSGESLSIFIRDNGLLSENLVKFFANCILQGIQHIHSKKIIHCDIKPDNILLARSPIESSPIGLIPKIADFGLAVESDGADYHYGVGHYRGTTQYMSPELTKYGYLGYCTDVWAYGCSVLEMLSGRRVWSEHGKIGEEHLKVLIGGSDVIPHIPCWLSDEAQDFLFKCFERNPMRRAKVETLLGHLFLTSNYDL